MRRTFLSARCRVCFSVPPESRPGDFLASAASAWEAQPLGLLLSGLLPLAEAPDAIPRQRTSAFKVGGRQLQLSPQPGDEPINDGVMHEALVIDRAEVFAYGQDHTQVVEPDIVQRLAHGFPLVAAQLIVQVFVSEHGTSVTLPAEGRKRYLCPLTSPV